MAPIPQPFAPEIAPLFQDRNHVIEVDSDRHRVFGPTDPRSAQNEWIATDDATVFTRRRYRVDRRSARRPAGTRFQRFQRPTFLFTGDPKRPVTDGEHQKRIGSSMLNSSPLKIPRRRRMVQVEQFAQRLRAPHRPHPVDAAQASENRWCAREHEGEPPQ
ncbi:hypothetical protein ACQP2U_19795 [Nocardia sp. CA-084685]|uniref:hypothetical protein n=1 Tax=Nocardia sp. CA-084685 TaxID=3239970 RepID=UPI003D98CCED